MPTLTVRQLEDDIYQGLKAQAESQGRSMEAEVRDILAEAVRGRRWWPQWVAATKALRGEDRFHHGPGRAMSICHNHPLRRY